MAVHLVRMSVAAAPSNTTWDRSTSAGTGAFAGIYQRGAYYSHFLVLSGDPDKMPGTAQLGVDYKTLDERGSFPLSDGSFAGTRDGTEAVVPLNVINVISVENQGGKIDPNRVNGGPPLGAGRNDTNALLEEFGNDDITTQNLHSPGGPLPAPSK